MDKSQERYVGILLDKAGPESLASLKALPALEDCHNSDLIDEALSVGILESINWRIGKQFIEHLNSLAKKMHIDYHRITSNYSEIIPNGQELGRKDFFQKLTEKLTSDVIIPQVRETFKLIGTVYSATPNIGLVALTGTLNHLGILEGRIKIQHNREDKDESGIVYTIKDANHPIRTDLFQRGQMYSWLKLR